MLLTVVGIFHFLPFMNCYPLPLICNVSAATQVDPSVSFDQVGGLEHYIKALKEMVFLPLVYPELFERFHLSPPRGVLFYGPPGNAMVPLLLLVLVLLPLLRMLVELKGPARCIRPLISYKLAEHFKHSVK